MALSREEQLAAIERYYSAQVAGLPSDEEELAVAEALLEQARRGHVVNDAGTDTILIQSAAEIPVDADFMVDDDALRRQDLRRALPVAAMLALGLLLVLALYGGGGGEKVATPSAIPSVQVSLVTATLTPMRPRSHDDTPTPTATSSPTPTQLPTATPTPLAPEEIEVKPEPVKLDAEAVIPVSLEIAGRYFPVVPTGLRGDGWAYVTDPAQASWLAGSYVNVVLGLPYGEDTLDLVGASLALSDTLVLRNSVGAVHGYTVADRRQAGVYEIEAFSQRRAGLTLVLLGGNDERPDHRLLVWAVPATAGEEVVLAQGE